MVEMVKNERDERLVKLEKIREMGLDPYPAKVERSHSLEAVLDSFDKFVKNDAKLAIVGRVMTIRSHGNLTFITILDDGHKIQVAVSKKELSNPEMYKPFIKLIDIADFVSIKGRCFTTHTGEKSVMASEWKLLAKAIRPLPEKWHGIKDEEERLRKRYLDILMNPELRDMIEKKARFWQATREFLINKDFLEVETPVLETTAGGADAEPFITHHNALDIDVYLRISMGELWQKKLMVAGFGKTFEIGRQFRNEGMDAEHLQDYTQMEYYWGYADYRMNMKLVEEMYKYIAERTFGTLEFKIKDFNINLGKKWKEYNFVDTVKKETNIDVTKASLEDMKLKLQELGVEYDNKGFNITRAIDNLWKYCRKKIAGPGFLVGTPIAISPLAKKDEKNPNVAQRFQVLIAGSELGNGYSELNDPLDQAERFNQQQILRDAGDTEAQMKDEEFIEALEHGMPPTSGFGMSERVFSFLMNKSARECQIFPLMRPKR